jgi:hypothetical protein
MKQILLILSTLAIWDLQAQKKEIKLYGFSQAISKGMRASMADEKGEINTEKKKDSKTLMIFLEAPKESKIKITELWINGEKYRFDMAPVKTPVILNTGLHMPGQKDSVLIPENNNDISRIIPGTKMEMTEKDKRKIVNRKPLVVFYTLDGKTCKRSLDKLDVLPELVME